MSVAHDNEWKEGYRDGLAAALTVVRTVADDEGTAGDAAALLEVLATSHVLDTPLERYPEPPANT